MSEVKRFYLDATEGRRPEMVEDPDGYYCEFNAYRDAQSELAALREELAGAKHDIASFLETMAKVCDLLGINTDDAKHAEGNPSDVFFSHATDIRKRLTAAEQRNAELEARKNLSDKELIEIARNAALNSCQRYAYLPSLAEDLYAWNPHWWVIEAMRAALKPTELGASE